MNRASFYLVLGISATAPGRLLINHCAVAGWGDGKGPGPACQTEPALQENIPCKLLRLLPGRNGTVRARGFCPGVEESSERAVQKDGQGTIGQRDNAACATRPDHILCRQRWHCARSAASSPVLGRRFVILFPQRVPRTLPATPTPSLPGASPCLQLFR